MTNLSIEQYIKILGSDHLGRFGGDFEGGIRIQQNPMEFAKFINFLLDQKRQFKNYLEIGSASGGGCFVLNKYLNFEKIVIVDDNEHPWHILRKSVLKDITRTEIVGNSHETDIFNRVNEQGYRFDLIMIDGDHSYEGVKMDITIYSPLLNPNGFIILHDISQCMCGVGRLAKEIEKRFLDFKLIAKFVEEEGCLGIGVYGR